MEIFVILAACETQEMPKRKQRKVKAPPKEQLSLSKDEDNTKGSKEERMRALQLFVDDFDIQGEGEPRAASRSTCDAWDRH